MFFIDRVTSPVDISTLKRKHNHNVTTAAPENQPCQSSGPLALVQLIPQCWQKSGHWSLAQRLFAMVYLCLKSHNTKPQTKELFAFLIPTFGTPLKLPSVVGVAHFLRCGPLCSEGKICVLVFKAQKRLGPFQTMYWFLILLCVVAWHSLLCSCVLASSQDFYKILVGWGLRRLIDWLIDCCCCCCCCFHPLFCFWFWEVITGITLLNTFIVKSWGNHLFLCTCNLLPY